MKKKTFEITLCVCGGALGKQSKMFKGLLARCVKLIAFDARNSVCMCVPLLWVGTIHTTAVVVQNGDALAQQN